MNLLCGVRAIEESADLDFFIKIGYDEKTQTFRFPEWTFDAGQVKRFR